MRVFVLLLISISCVGCQTVEEKAQAKGNATYDVSCPVILSDGSVATYTDEAGKVRPAMSHFTVASGRKASGGVDVDIPGCIKIKIPKLEQGEDRSGSVLGKVGWVIVSIIGIFIPLPI